MAPPPLNARARSIDLRLSVMAGTGALDGVTLYQPVDLITGRPALGDDPATNVLSSLDEVEQFLDREQDAGLDASTSD